jgi:hypothetical protein
MSVKATPPGSLSTKHAYMAGLIDRLNAQELIAAVYRRIRDQL